MAIEVKVPVLPESVADATVSSWHKKVGDSVKRDEVLVELETDKVMLEVPAPADGVLKSISEQAGAIVTSDTVLATIGAAGSVPSSSSDQEADPEQQTDSAQAAAMQSAEISESPLSPSVRRLINEHELSADNIVGTGKDGRITKQDVLAVIKAGGAAAQSTPVAKQTSAAPVQPKTEPAAAPTEEAVVAAPMGARTEERVRMTRLRQRIAERLVSVQHESAMLTTFNEVNMQPVMELRKKYKDQFEKSHGVRLGFMSFFINAALEALKRYPLINASIDGDDIVYHNYFDIGVAVGTKTGLVVPVLRNVENMSMAQIEKQVREYGSKARDGKITLEDMTGGTFTITNGGVYGSMLSTPIINPPQSAILGMHNIVERPVVENSQVVVRPVMYLALSYDHRIVDGKDAVGFLVAIKEFIEDPSRLLLQV